MKCMNHNLIKQTNTYSKKEFEDISDKNYLKVGDHYHYRGKYKGTSHSICVLRNEIPQEIPAVIYEYDYHFIIKELSGKFEGQFECLGKNTETCMIFSVPI